MRAVIAILVDAYRELSSRKIFWITLLLSLILVAAYASIGFTEEGMSMFFGLYSIETEFFNADSPLSPVLYRGIFVTFIVSIWLAWAATILALISTASIFPDLVAQGSIDLILSKPVTRLTVFAAKYGAGLLFAILQVGIVCVGVFLALGWRLGEWNPMIFLALPIVVVFFSYIYCISALVGVVARSAISALLVAILFWFVLFSLQTTESMVFTFKSQAVMALEQAEESIEENQRKLEELAEDDPGLLRAQRALLNAEQGLEAQQTIVDRLTPWHRRIDLILTALPKTGQTIGLLDRWLVREGDIGMNDLMQGNFDFDEEGNIVPHRPPETDLQRRIQEHYDQKTLWYIIGTSLLFEFFVLALAAWVFCRRDF